MTPLYCLERPLIILNLMVELRSYQLNAVNEAFEAMKLNDDPVLLECSVGGGKSYLLSSIAKTMDDLNKRVLCLVNSSELVRNNSSAFKDFKGNPSIFCSSLSEKSYDKNVIFATPQSVISALKNEHPIKDIIFNMIIVDEAHSINFFSDTSTFMRILRHYKQQYKLMRILGLTGTAFRGDTSIVAKNAFFKTKVGNISTQYLIENKFLVPPVFGYKKVESFDFSKCKTNNMGEFKSSELQKVIDQKKRLTWDILQEVQVIMKDRNSSMIFCSTKAHCHEAFAALPEGSARIILGDTPDDVRHESLTMARNGQIKWLISVNCLLTGVNITSLNGIVWLRPTSSLLLFIQGIGRGLRLHPGKEDCLVLDYASNLTRFSDIDHPIINEAIQPRGDHAEEERPFKCWKCSTQNSIHSRRCVGMVDGKRCDHFFEFKSCPVCAVQSDVKARNDITARQCRSCGHELIDPNAKLTRTVKQTYNLKVIEATYWIGVQGQTSNPIINAKYRCDQGDVFECHLTNTPRSKNIAYSKFIRLHVAKPSDYYMRISNLHAMKEMIALPTMKTPQELQCTKDDYGRWTLVKKVFNADL